MFTIDQDGKVRYDSKLVSADQFSKLSEAEKNEYGRLCVKAMEQGLEPERIKLLS